jgi:hypothetical protein
LAVAVVAEMDKVAVVTLMAVAVVALVELFKAGYQHQHKSQLVQVAQVKVWVVCQNAVVYTLAVVGQEIQE